MNLILKILLIVVSGLASLFVLLKLVNVLTEMYRKWRRKRTDEEYEAWREKVREKADRVQKSDKPNPPSRTIDKVQLARPIASAATQQAESFDYAARATRAYQDGLGLIEAYFFAQLAKNGGHRQINFLISEIKIAWRRMGYPSEKELVREDFGSRESAIGRACLRLDTGHERDLGEACLRDLAMDGDEIAGMMLRKRGIVDAGR